MLGVAAYKLSLSGRVVVLDALAAMEGCRAGGQNPCRVGSLRERLMGLGRMFTFTM